MRRLIVAKLLLLCFPAVLAKQFSGSVMEPKPIAGVPKGLWIPPLWVLTDDKTVRVLSASQNLLQLLKTGVENGLTTDLMYKELLKALSTTYSLTSKGDIGTSKGGSRGTQLITPVPARLKQIFEKLKQASKSALKITEKGKEKGGKISSGSKRGEHVINLGLISLPLDIINGFRGARGEHPVRTGDPPFQEIMGMFSERPSPRQPTLHSLIQEEMVYHGDIEDENSNAYGALSRNILNAGRAYMEVVYNMGVRNGVFNSQHFSQPPRGQEFDELNGSISAMISVAGTHAEPPFVDETALTGWVMTPVGQNDQQNRYNTFLWAKERVIGILRRLPQTLYYNTRVYGDAGSPSAVRPPGRNVAPRSTRSGMF